MGAHIEYTVIVLGDGHQGFAADKSAATLMMLRDHVSSTLLNSCHDK